MAGEARTSLCESNQWEEHQEKDVGTDNGGLYAYRLERKVVKRPGAPLPLHLTWHFQGLFRQTWKSMRIHQQIDIYIMIPYR